MQSSYFSEEVLKMLFKSKLQYLRKYAVFSTLLNLCGLYDNWICKNDSLSGMWSSEVASM